MENRISNAKKNNENWHTFFSHEEPTLHNSHLQHEHELLCLKSIYLATRHSFHDMCFRSMKDVDCAKKLRHWTHDARTSLSTFWTAEFNTFGTLGRYGTGSSDEPCCNEIYQ